MKKSLIFIFICVLVSNFIRILQIGKPYSFQSDNCEFKYRAVPTKGSTIDNMEKEFGSFQSSSLEYQNLQLYRRFKIEVWKFWKWREYLFDKKWKYAYRNTCQ